MANPSFDIVSKVDHQEVANAVTQTAKELGQRFDFRGVDAGIDWNGGDAINLHAETEERVRAAYEVFRDKLVKRSISLKAVHADEPRQSGKTSRLTAHLKEGIEQDLAKKIGKLIRDEGPKGVQAQIQGDQLRVTGKKKDDLQAVISLLKDGNFDVPLQFTNYR